MVEFRTFNLKTLMSALNCTVLIYCTENSAIEQFVQKYNCNICILRHNIIKLILAKKNIFFLFFFLTQYVPLLKLLDCFICATLNINLHDCSMVWIVYFM